MQETIAKMFELKEWAVLGATPTQTKFGYKIFKKLQGCKFNVIPVNPLYDSIEGITCVSDLSKPMGIEVVNIVVSPKRSLLALDDIAAQGIRYVWFQPGTYDDEVIRKAQSLGLEIVYGYCVLVELGDLPYCSF